jgi:O-antigen/teichoic acid export membrane protein
VVLNTLLIPVMGINGAALASLLTQIFTNVGLGFIIKPIRRNNLLMMRGLNPKYILNMLPVGKR